MAARQGKTVVPEVPKVRVRRSRAVPPPPIAKPNRQRNEDRPLTAKEQRFIRLYTRPDVRDIERAAQLAGLPARDGKVLWNRPEVREEIDRRLRLVELEQARLDAENEVLRDSDIDQALFETMQLDAKEFGSTKLSAITLALVVKGRIETRNAKAVTAAAGGAQQSAFGPTIYGSIGSINPTYTATYNPQLPPGASTTTLRRTEEVIQTTPAQGHQATQLPEAPAHVFEVIER